MPLLLAAFFAISIVQIAVQLGISLAGIDAMLRQGAWAYGVVAGLTLLLLSIGLLFEVWAGPDLRRPIAGSVPMNLLRALTSRHRPDALAATMIDAAALAASLKAAVIGQDGVCDDVAAQVRRRLAMIGRDRPLGVFLLAGPPGTGKTLLAKRLASALGRDLLHLDMAQFSASHASSGLFGSPRGYTGSESYGKLTAALGSAPDSVVLLDEIEKAHPDVLKKFLVAWNDGIVTEASDGAVVSCRRALFMLTSNAATEALAEAADTWRSSPDRLREEASAILRRSGFAAEALDRIDQIFVFHALEPSDLEIIAELEVEALLRRYGLEAAKGDIDQAILFDIMRTQARRNASARDLARAVESRLGDALIEARAKGAVRVRLSQGEHGILVETLA